jgi:hypothetical protein
MEEADKKATVFHYNLWWASAHCQLPLQRVYMQESTVAKQSQVVYYVDADIAHYNIVQRLE